MVSEKLIRELSQLEVGERAFLSIFASESRSKALPKLMRQYRDYLRIFSKDDDSKDEVKYLEDNLKMVQDYIEKNPRGNRSMAIFCCAELGYFRAVELAADCETLLWVDSSPYIRPLVQDSQNYENVAVIVADNKRAEVHLVTALKSVDRKMVEGNVKNHVKKGGWSQKRYERRREKQLDQYTKEILRVLRQMHSEAPLSHILMVGGRETLQAIYNLIPKRYQHLVHEKTFALKVGRGIIREELFGLYGEAKEDSAKDIAEKIKREYCKSGLGIAGPKDVLEAAKLGQVEIALVDKEAKVKGYRCSQCNYLGFEPMDDCEAHDGEIFEVDMIEKIIEILRTTSAKVVFTDKVPELKEAGGIAALLRFKV